MEIEAGKARAGLRPGAPVNARRMDHVNMYVRDLDVSAAFMPRFLDLRSRNREVVPGGRWCIIGAPDRFYLCLVEMRGAERFTAEGIHINHVGFVVDDIDETLIGFVPLAFGSNVVIRPLTGPAAGRRTSQIRMVS